MNYLRYIYFSGMINKAFFILIVISVSLSCQEQKKSKEVQTNSADISIQSQSVKPDDNLIGFACFEDGRKSQSVELFSELLTKKDYTGIRNRLVNENPAEKYLASIVCLKLQEKKMIELTTGEQKQIKSNKRSFDLVSICSGCTDREERTMLELFKPNQSFIHDEIEAWLKEMIK